MKDKWFLEFNCVFLIEKIVDGLEFLLSWFWGTPLPITNIFEENVCHYIQKQVHNFAWSHECNILIIFLAQDILGSWKFKKYRKNSKIQDTRHIDTFQDMYRIQEVVKFYLLLIFTRFLWKHPLSMDSLWVNYTPSIFRPYFHPLPIKDQTTLFKKNCCNPPYPNKRFLTTGCASHSICNWKKKSWL